MIRLKVSRSRLVSFFLFYGLAVGPIGTAAAPRVDIAAVPARFKPISLQEFWGLVLAGKEVTGRLVPYRFVLCVLQNADQLVKRSHTASLKLRASRITEGTIKLTKPFRSINEYSPELQDHLRSRKLAKAAYVPFSIEMSNTIVDANLYLNDVVFQREISFQNVDFRGSLYFQGAAFEERAVFKSSHFQGTADFSACLVLAGEMQDAPQGEILRRIGQYVRRWKRWVAVSGVADGNRRMIERKHQCLLCLRHPDSAYFTAHS